MSVKNEPGWFYIEHLGDLYRGFSVSWPQIRWDDNSKKWVEYADKDTFKPEGWGTIIGEDEAQRLMDA